MMDRDEKVFRKTFYEFPEKFLMDVQDFILGFYFFYDVASLVSR